MNQTSMNLAHYKFLVNWTPQIGDFLVYHGLIYGRWFGVINAISPNGDITVIKSGLPLLLLSMDTSEYQKNQQVLSLASVRNSTGGKYAAVRAVGNNLIWFV